MPNEFVSELRLSTDGSYGFVYEGELVWIPLVMDMRDPQKKMTPQQIGDSIAVLDRDLRRDSNFKDIRSLGDGRFKVRYEAQGRLDEKGIFIFLRRTDRLVVLETLGDGTARITSKAVKIDQRKQVMDSGITVRGKFRVVTNGTATQGNAQKFKPLNYQNYVIYDWEIENAETPSPVLYVDLKKPAVLSQ